MISEVSKILMCFYQCFSRGASFYWFVITIVGLIIRLDHHGISSIIRWLGLKPNLYGSFLNFFRASSWKLENIQHCWLTIVKSRCPTVTIEDHLLFVGDGTKVSKEANYMPGVKKLHQESDNSGKPSYITGHHFGVLGLLAGNEKRKIFCIPIMAEIHEGVDRIRDFQGKDSPILEGIEQTTLVTLMASAAIRMATQLGKKCLIILDGYFSVGPTFLIAKELVDQNGNRLLHLITRAKKNVVAYEDPPPKTGKRGRPRIYGNSLKLMKLFKLRQTDFQEAEIKTYNQEKTISFLWIDLIWKPIKEKVRFVLVQDGENQFILMCSDLNIDPLNIIRAYSYRFKIEVSFKVMKHLIGSFGYHFWTFAWPKLGNKTTSDLTNLSSKKQQLIASSVNAIEGFVNFGCIATGILQIIAINHERYINHKYCGWLRTVSSEVPFEKTVMSVIREEFSHNSFNFRITVIYGIIMSKSRKPFMHRLEEAA